MPINTDPINKTQFYNPDEVGVTTTDIQPVTLEDKKRDVFLKRLTEKEAIEYATEMGMSDSWRGIKQIFGQITGKEDLLESLKNRDEKLKAIFEHPKFGQKAFGTYLGSAVALDPIGWIPFAGWAKKAKTIKQGLNYGLNLGQSFRYGVGTGAAYSGIGYYGEGESRLEGTLMGGTLGGTLGYTIPKVSNAIRKKLGKEPFVPSLVDEQQQIRKRKFEQAKTGDRPAPEDIEAAKQAALDAIKDESTGVFSKSISGLNLRKNYEDIIGAKVWDVMVQNWGEALAGTTAFAGSYSALSDPDATELEKFGAALAYGAAAALGVKGIKKIKIPSPVKGEEDLTLGQWISKGFVDNYGLDPKYVDIKKTTLADVNSLRSQWLDIVKYTSENLTEPEQKVFYAMLHGNFNEVTPELKGLTKTARRIIKETGQQLVDVGLLNPKTFRKNADYLHRSYSSKMVKEQNLEFSKTIREFKIIGDELRPRGVKPKEITRAYYLKNKKSFLEQGYEDLGDARKIPDEMKVLEQFTESQWKNADKKKYKLFLKRKDGKVFAEDLTKIKLRRDWTLEERKALGEIENASFGLAETGRLMTNDLAAYKLFQNISESNFALSADDFAKAVSDGNLNENQWVKISDNYKFADKPWEIKEWGKLAGKYVPQEVYNDLTKVIKLQDDSFSKLVTKNYGSLVALWKKSKTAWNPVVHVNNTAANVIMYDNAGGQYKYLNRAVQEFRKGLTGDDGAFIYNAAKELGVMDVDIVSRELNDETLSVLDKAIKELSRDGVDEINGTMNYAGKVYKGFSKFYDMTFGKMENWYQGEDQIFRLALFMDRLNKGYSPAEAARDAKKWFIDYDINAPAINFLKQTATPFISYTYRVIPLLAETAAKKPWKLAKWSGLGYLLNEAGKQYGAGSEEAERLLLGERGEQKMFGVPGFSPTLIKTPFVSERKTKQGEMIPLYIDTQRFIPGGDIFSMGNASIPIAPLPFSEKITGKKEYLQLPAAVTPNFGVAGEILIPALFGIDPFTKEKIDGLGVGNDSAAKIQHILSRLNPNIPAPGLFGKGYESYSSKRIREAFEREASSGEKQYGTQFTPLEAILNSFGLKLQPVEFSKLLRIEDNNFRQVYSTVRQRYYKLMKDYAQNPSPQEKERMQKELDKLYKILDNETRKYNTKRLRALEAKRESKRFGGEVLDKEYPVTDVKENPSERINPYTDEPYLEERIPLQWGGELNYFTPLADELENLMSMQENVSAEDMGLGPMSEEEGVVKKERKQFSHGGFGGHGEADEKTYLMFYNMAKNAGLEFPEAVAAQASLESGHGKSKLTTEYNNPLGIKVNRKSEVEAGQQAVKMPTKEVFEGKEGTYEEPFRVFENIEESFLGYKQKVEDPRYDSIRKATNSDEYLEAIQNSGYATDPKYAEKTKEIKNRYAFLLPKD